MAIILSTNYSKQLLALDRGPGRGVAAPVALSDLQVMSDKVALPIATITAATDYVRLMKVPKGAIIYASLSKLVTDHSAAIAGKLQFVPIDGIGSTQDLTGVTANIAATTATSFTEIADDFVVAKDSWVQFVPTADTAIATTVKYLKLHLAFGLLGC